MTHSLFVSLFAQTRRAHGFWFRGSLLFLLVWLPSLSAQPTGYGYELAATGSWRNVRNLGTPRQRHTATTLRDGRILVAGGLTTNSQALASCELYDPATDTWTPTGSLSEARQDHKAVLLNDGRVLVVGRQTAELYDPVTGNWTLTGEMQIKATGPANYETASLTVLANGKALVVGGRAGQLSFPQGRAELYDPATNTWTFTGSLNEGRYLHAALLLDNGKVLVTGGSIRAGTLNSCELYDPATGQWSRVAALKFPHTTHAAFRLANGSILVAGGGSRVTEIYQPATNTWRLASSSNFALNQGTITQLTDGRILATAVRNEIFDPQTERWTVMADPLLPRILHSISALPNGKALAVGGTISNTVYRNVEVFDPLGSLPAGAWQEAPRLDVRRQGHTTTLLDNGKALIVAGGWQYASFNDILASALFYDVNNGWTSAGSLTTPRRNHTATTLPNGQVLVVGGDNSPTSTLLSTELFTPATINWQLAAPLSLPRHFHTAALLNNGKVLIAGGANENTNLPNAELYDPALNRWSTTGALSTPRRFHTMTLLENGKVLVTGGESNGNAIASAELYDPTTGMWTATGTMTAARRWHTATRLPDGKVLVVGGGNDAPLASAEMYDPAQGIWRAVASLNFARQKHSATLLKDGRVLIAGGAGNEGLLFSTEYFDVTANNGAGAVVETDSLGNARESHTALLLPNGNVLAVGGFGLMGGDPESLASVERFDPAGVVPVTPPRITPVAASTYRGGELATDSIVAVFGEGFTNVTTVAQSTPLPTSLGNVTVRVGDFPAYLFFVSPNQINLLLASAVRPFPPGPSTLTITTSNGAVLSEPLFIATVAPGLFSADASGRGLAAAEVLRVKANGEQVYEPIVRFDAAQNRFVAVPIELSNANEQVYLILYGSGMRYRSSLSAVRATVGGLNAEALYTGSQGSYAGLDQVNLRLPASLAGRGEVDVELTIDGSPSNIVKINCK